MDNLFVKRMAIAKTVGFILGLVGGASHATFYTRDNDDV